MLPDTLIGAQLSLFEMCMNLSVLHYVCFNRKNTHKNFKIATGSEPYNTIFNGHQNFHTLLESNLHEKHLYIVV